MAKNVQMPDGSVVAFPDGMSDAQISQEGSKYVSQKYETKLTPSDEADFQVWKQKYAPNDSGFDYDLRGAFKAGLKPDGVNGHWDDQFKKPNHPTFSTFSQYAKDAPQLAGTWNGDTYVPPKSPISIVNPQQQQQQVIPPTNAAGKIQSTRPAVHALPPPSPEVMSGQSTTKPLSVQDLASLLKVPASVTPAIDAGTAAATMTPGGPIPKAIAGIGTGAATYLGLHKILSGLAGEDDSIGGAAKDLAINEVGGQAINLIKKGFNGVLPAALEEFGKLKPTLSQWMDKLATDYPGAAGKVASILKTPTKVAEDFLTPGAKANSILQSGKLARQEATGLAADVSGRTPSAVSDPEELALKTQTGLENLHQAYTNESNKQAQSFRLLAQGAPQQTSQGNIVNGPIQLKNTLEEANRIVERNRNLIAGPSQDAIKGINEADRLIASTNAKFDPQTGQLISADPMGAGEAWDKKQDYGNSTRFQGGKLDDSQRDFKNLFHTMNQDIENSIPSWDDKNKTAMKSFQNAKAIVGERIATFDPDGAKAATLKDVIDNSDSPLPQLKQILSNPPALQRAVDAGTTRFPSGRVTSTKGDFGAAFTQQLWKDAETLDPKGGISIDAKKLYNDYMDPSNYQQKKILFNAQNRSDMEQLIKNAAMTQDKGGTWAPKIWMIRTGMAIPAAIALGTGGAEHAAVTGSIEMGASLLTKMITNPSTARVLVNMAAGQPLNMSEQMASRKLMSVLQGTVVTLRGSDGSAEQGTFDKDGKFTPQSSSGQ